MRFLVINTDYPEFLVDLYERTPGLADAPFATQMSARMATMFGVADFYTHALRELGHDAFDIHANNGNAQRAWAREHGIRLEPRRWHFRMRRGWVPWLSRGEEPWKYQILEEQIRHYRPDVLLNQSMDGLDNRFFKRMKPFVGKLVGQHAAPLAQDDFSGYDIFVSSLPNLVERFQNLDIPSYLVRLGFDPRVLQRLPKRERTIDVSFVGSISPDHATRLRWLERVCEECDVQVWGTGAERLPSGSPIAARHHGRVWGLAMYEVMRDSRITLNAHIDMAGPWANNLRLYEATGVGTLLLTDMKDNLHEIFEPGREVAAYRSTDECVELIRHYVASEAERAAVAGAGRQRTLTSHDYVHRMREFVELLANGRNEST